MKMKVTLYLHDGTKHEEDVKDFNLADFIEEVNTEQHKMIQFGGLGIMKNAIKMIDTNQ